MTSLSRRGENPEPGNKELDQVAEGSWLMLVIVGCGRGCFLLCDLECFLQKGRYKDIGDNG